MHRWIFFIIVVSLLFVYTLYRAAMLWPAQKSVAIAMVFPFFIVMTGWFFLYQNFPGLMDSKWFYIAAWAGSLAMAFWSTLMMLGMPVDIAKLLAVFMKKTGFTPSFNPVRREVLTGLLGMSVGLTGIGFLSALRKPRIKEIMVSLPSKAAKFSDLKIAQISDLHVGPTIRKGYVEEVVRLTNSVEPDLIVVTGDLVDGSPEALHEHMQPLSKLKAKLGVYFVTGNHEYYWNAERWLDAVRKLGFIPLLNENRVLDFQGAKILLAGVTDTSAGRFLSSHQQDLQKAVFSSEEASARILLSHRPDNYAAAEKLGFDFQFSGHTHAGQFFPFNIFVAMAYKYYKGLNRHGNLWLYVNAGTGYWGPANRFGIPAEISLLRLSA